MKWLKTIDNELIPVESIRRIYLGLNTSEFGEDDFVFSIVVVTNTDWQHVLETFSTESQAIDQLESLLKTLNS